ncbi:MAG TPA: hypothetical protein VII48_02460, partial [Rhizomicrobium sp.]
MNDSIISREEVFQMRGLWRAPPCLVSRVTKRVWNLSDLLICPEPSGYLIDRVTEWDSVKGGF